MKFRIKKVDFESFLTRVMSTVAQSTISKAMSPEDYAKMVVAFTRNHPSAIDPKKAPQNMGGTNIVQALACQVDITAAFVANDTISLGYLPKGAIPLFGFHSGVDIDTGTETLDLDIGIAANGVDSADPDFFSNGGVLTGDAIATEMPLTNAAYVRLFLPPFPVMQLGARTEVKLTCIAASNAGHVGKLDVVIFYITPGYAAS